MPWDRPRHSRTDDHDPNRVDLLLARLGDPGKVVIGAPAHRHPFLNYIGHTIVGLISIFVLVITGIYWNITDAAGKGIVNNSVNAGFDNHSGVTAGPPGAAGVANQTGQTTYAPENFLLVGSDTRAGANNIDGSGAGANGGSNTDSLMVLHISGDRQRVAVISLPRDLWAPNVPCHTYDTTNNTYGDPAASNNLSKQHINAFYGVGGPACLVDAVENLTQLTITRYVQIDFSGFSSMVDALGGVSINACGPIIDATLGTVLPAGGQQTINGAQALNLARAREVQGDTASDIARIHRQQMILSSILRSVKSAGTLLDPGKLSAFVTAFTGNTTTSGVDFQTLMALAESLGSLDPAHVNFWTLPTVPDPDDTSDRGSMFIDQSRADVLLNAIRADQPVPGSLDPTPTETPAPSTTASSANPTLTVAPAAVDLAVVNATAVSGLAGEAATALKALGFSIDLQTDLEKVAATDVQAGITVQYSAGNEAAALTVAAAVTGSTLVATDGLGSRVKLLLGTSYQNELTAVTVGDAVSGTLLAQIPDGSAANVITPTTTASAATETGTSTPPVNAADTNCL